MPLLRKCSLVVVVLAAVLSPSIAGAIPLTPADQPAFAHYRGGKYAIAQAVVYADNARRGAEIERARAAAVAQARARQGARSKASVGAAAAPSASGHDPCAEPISGLLPDYIVQRESHGQCGAYNHGGCGGRGCLGWAQIDEGHFWADSPWGPGPGSCYGLSYNGCVSKLSAGGTNLDPWKCC